MRADPSGGPVEQLRARAGWRPASQSAGKRDVVRCHACEFGRASGSANRTDRWRCERGAFATSAHATCDHAVRRPKQETPHD